MTGGEAHHEVLLNPDDIPPDTADGERGRGLG